MTKSKVYDLEERSFQFSKNVAIFCRKIPKNSANFIYVKQLLRSSSSIGANYIEANEALSKKDFRMRVKIARKEAKETAYWLRLLIETNNDKINKKEADNLFGEAIELKKILSAMIVK
ncbi:MAG: hypothetical protein XD98_0133 [Microgenomates bacterium 39_6]|nr:MAG: hypothetical protein XD98_0133 [Microgenomates bacterium 39_6]